jgi:nucleoside-diphosphate-sugar epimerase
MRVFVTGGSGFIGERFVRKLIAGGHEVVCMSRSGATSAALHELGAEVLSGNLADPMAIRRIVPESKPTHIAHLAAEIATQRSARKIEQVNVAGTRALVDACREIPLSKFLFLSTVVRGPGIGETFTEDAYIPATTPYGRSKEAGDRMIFDAFSEWSLPGVVLRPSHVYGAGGWFEGLVHDKTFRIPGKGENLWDVVHVDDVVSACVLLLDKGVAGEAYHVVDDEPLTMNQFFAAVAEARERKPYGHVPVWLAKVIAGSGAITSAVRSAKSTNAKLKALGWAPEHPRAVDAIPAVIRELARPTA